MACNALLVWNESKVTSREGVAPQCGRRRDRYHLGSTNPGIELNTQSWPTVAVGLGTYTEPAERAQKCMGGGE